MKRRQDDKAPAPVHKKPRLTETCDTDTPSSLRTTTQLQHALDFSALDSPSTISERFDLVGHALLNDFELVVRALESDTVFEILELELYLWRDGHEDPFAHCSEEQKASGRWYFHRSPRRSADSHRSATSLTGYRGGSRKGMDLTLGSPAPPLPTISPYFSNGADTVTDQASTSAIRGGSLLRSIRRVSDSKVISGPSLLVDEILRLSGTTTISELVEQKWSNDTCAFASRASTSTSLFLRPKAASGSGSGSSTVYRSPRIGLDLSHPGTTASPAHPRVVFLARRYRYFTRPELLTANGRAQTFLGVLRACLEAGHDLDDGRLHTVLKGITALGEPTVARYLGYFKQGRREGRLERFVGAKGKGASQSPATYLVMMGTLEQYRASD